jgi:hypothetical protein
MNKIVAPSTRFHPLARPRRHERDTGCLVLDQILEKIVHLLRDLFLSDLGGFYTTLVKVAHAHNRRARKKGGKLRKKKQQGEGGC